MLISMSIIICNKYFYMAKTIRARKVQTFCYIKPKPWSHISGPGSWVLASGSSILVYLSWFLDLEFQILGPGSLILFSGS